MSDTKTLELPEEAWQELVKAATESDTTPVGWIASRLPHHGSKGKLSKSPSKGEVARANARLRETIVHYGRELGTDNEEIDRDIKLLI
jgi:hypothetical protein